MVRLSLCLVVLASLQAAVAALQLHGRQLLQQPQEDEGYRLLHSMHCFARTDNAFMSAVDWAPSSTFAVRSPAATCACNTCAATVWHLQRLQAQSASSLGPPGLQ